MPDMTAARPKQSIRDRIKDFRRVKASELRAHPLNWRTHGTNQRDALGGLLSEIGFAGAVLARETEFGLELIDGHLRREMTEDMEIPVLVTDLNEAEAALLLAAYDPIAALAEADKDNLDALLKSVQTDDEALRRLLDDVARDAGVKITETKDAEPKIDRAAELQREWSTSSGQLWRIGEHRLLIGDSTKREDVERLMQGERADCVYTDPPYGYDKGIEGDDSIDSALPVYSLSMQLAPVLSDAWAIVDTPKKYISEFMRATESAGWKPREPVLHMYRNSMANGPYGTNIFELSFVYSKGSPKIHHRHLNAVDVARKAGSDNMHPTQKFADSYAHFIEVFCPPVALIYDAFAGSGTTGIACENLHRRARMIEISPAYAAVCLQRMKDAFGIVGELAG